MGRLIPNSFRVVQILLDTAVIVSLRDYGHFPKEVDYCCVTENDFRLFHPISHFLRLEKGVPDLSFSN